jgi:hypothetical protein
VEVGHMANVYNHKTKKGGNKLLVLNYGWVYELVVGE